MRQVRVCSVSEVEAGRARAFQTDGLKLVLARAGDDFHAVENRCPHMGWSLAGGKVDGCVLRCPWHGSTYDMGTGENIDWVSSIRRVRMPEWSRKLIALGRKPAPVRAYKIIRRADDLFVELE